MSEDTKLMTIETIYIFIVILTAAAVFAFCWIVRELPFLFIPVQREQVEVVGRRKTIGTQDADGTTGSTFYYVKFKFPDGSLKEILIGSNGDEKTITDFIHDGDTGILIYKEKEGGEGGIGEKYFQGRRFISFEKDPEYGGEKVEEPPPPIKTVGIIFVLIVLSIIVLIVMTVIEYKKKPAS